MGEFAVARHLEHREAVVDGRRATYGVGGNGFPVVFLHGWGLAEHAYKRALKRLILQGCRVYAPALPGFGETPELPKEQRTIEGFAGWVAGFMDAAQIEGPALLAGHSFGGGVAIRLAHDHPNRVAYLVLLNSVGGTARSPGPRALSALNLAAWTWALRAVRDPSPMIEGLQVLRAAAEDLIPNLLRHPRTMWEVGQLARSADLAAELEELGRRQLPVLVLWGDSDRVLPVGSFEALCGAIGTDGRVVSKGHSWLLADPDAFGEVMSNVVELSARAGSTELEQLLAGTSLPHDVVDTLIAGAAPLWLMSEPPATLAGDLVLCFPELARSEVRAVARPEEEHGSYRLTLVARDRPGLLADTTAVLASERLSVISASATTWTDLGIALHSLTVQAPPDFPPHPWDEIGSRLRAVGEGDRPTLAFVPMGRAHVRTTPQAMGRSLLSVTAPDQLGLLWAICDELASQGVSIEAARVTSTDGIAHDEFVISGAAVTTTALVARLSARRSPLKLRF
jgi:pimeloyl-ACP methyl ester carboxylesterase/glycine cleavage system regulatory protein